jgi:adenylate cyclase
LAGQWRVSSAVALQTVEIPTTLRGLMMARVDRLPEDLGEVLRSAAVIGLQFSARLLGEVQKRLHGRESILPSLERLAGLGLLVERPQVEQQMYAFSHILTQETIYRSLLCSQRPGLHQAVAECIEYLYGDDLGSHVEVLALHYDQARVRGKAMHYSLLAGDRAQERFANREAIEYYSRALQFSQHLSGREQERWHAAVGLGDVEQLTGEYEDAIACYRAALDEWAGASGQDRAHVMFKLAQVWEKRGDQQEAEGWLRQGLAHISSEGAQRPDLRAQIYSELGWLSLRRGDLGTAQERLEQSLALVSNTDHFSVLSSILNRLGAVHYHRGELSEAVRCVERALDLRDRLGDLVGYARSLNNLSILKHANGNWDGALTDLEWAAELHERIGEVEGLALASTNLGLLYGERGEWAKAEENLKRSFAIAQRIAHPYELAQAHTNLGRLYLLQERWQECAQHLDVAIPLYAEAGARANLNLNDDYYYQGVLSLELGQLDAASEWGQRSYDLLWEATGAETGESVEWGRYERLVGRICQARGDLEGALGHLERSAEILESSGSQIEAGRTAYRLGQLWIELGDRCKAGDHLAAAEKVFERLGAAADLRCVEDQLALLGSAC